MHTNIHEDSHPHMNADTHGVDVHIRHIYHVYPQEWTQHLMQIPALLPLLTMSGPTLHGLCMDSRRLCWCATSAPNAASSCWPLPRERVGAAHDLYRNESDNTSPAGSVPLRPGQPLPGSAQPTAGPWVGLGVWDQAHVPAHPLSSHAEPAQCRAGGLCPVPGEPAVFRAGSQDPRWGPGRCVEPGLEPAYTGCGLHWVWSGSGIGPLCQLEETN